VNCNVIKYFDERFNSIVLCDIGESRFFVRGGSSGGFACL